MKNTSYRLYFDISLSLSLLLTFLLDRFPIAMQAVLGSLVMIVLFINLGIYHHARQRGYMLPHQPHYPGRIIIMLGITGLGLAYAHEHFPQTSVWMLGLIGAGCVLFAVWREFRYWHYRYSY